MITCEVSIIWYAFGEDVGAGEGVGLATLRYDPADPVAVFIDFSGGVKWVVSRDVLLAGLVEPAGGGDVRIQPYKARIAMALTSPAGYGLVLLPRQPVETFAQQVRDIKDSPDIDRLISQIQKWGSSR